MYSSMLFFTSDNHFGHKNVIKYCDRPFKDVHTMNRTMIENWNATVGVKDTIIHVGDFSFAAKSLTRTILQKLNGYKILVRGNHDKSASQMLSLGFDVVCNSLNMRIGGENVHICHYPYAPKKNEPQVDLRYMDRRPPDTGGWLIHGHTHNRWKLFKKQINVSVENWDYKPVSIDELAKIIQKKS